MHRHSVRTSTCMLEVDWWSKVETLKQSDKIFNIDRIGAEYEIDCCMAWHGIVLLYMRCAVSNTTKMY